MCSVKYSSISLFLTDYWIPTLIQTECEWEWSSLEEVIEEPTLEKVLQFPIETWMRKIEEQGRSFEAFEWTYEPNFDLALMGNAKEWANWMEQESECFVQDHGYSKYGEIANWWLKTPEQEPLIVVEIPDKEKELRDYAFISWDGAHRIGISCLNHRLTASAFVGKIKKK